MTVISHTARVRFYPETKIINRTALDRNYFEREGSVSDFRIGLKGRHKFRINIEDNHNTGDFYIDMVVDLESKFHNGTVYYHGKPQSRILGPISYLKIEGESKASIATEYRVAENWSEWETVFSAVQEGSAGKQSSEETVTTKAMMQKDVEKTVSWYAYGVGLVKENTYDKKGKLVSTTLLNSINW